jgi:hypothetical protein
MIQNRKWSSCHFILSLLDSIGALICIHIWSNVAVKWLGLLRFIREVLRSDLSLENGYHDRIFVIFVSSPQANSGIVR